MARLSKMTVLLVGGGGREHALAWKLKQDDPSLALIAAPGNPGIADLAECVNLAATDVERLLELAIDRSVDLTVIGPEAPLAAGIVDRFREAGIPTFGPTQAAAEIETSKAFAKQLMLDADVPTARARIFETVPEAKDCARDYGAPVVIKASGLAAGKGVIVCETIAQADAAIESMLVGNAFGASGHQVLVEEFMQGEELSVFALTDGQRVLSLVPAQDHKRLLAGDRGPNTGGMGAYAPAALGAPAGDYSDLLMNVESRILLPTLAAMRERGRPFTGLLYAGLMITAQGPKVVEFNCRFGDPEAQAVLPIAHLTPSLLEVMLAVARGDGLPVGARCRAAGHAVTTVLAAAGYPDHPRRGDGIILPPPRADAIVFHAGTARDDDGRLITAGGRVLAVTGLGATFADAQRVSAEVAAQVAFAGKQYRDDIGWRERARGA
ncbi:MAG TPA: phosphoribosylamine--glycine ligase [Gemmatimonadaceae bacterium]|nr:phosphoribosylamine--glycine ligase [Gemmatimonadaceae bacterium]